MDPVCTLAIGIDLHFVSAADGGRISLLGGGNLSENRFRYRPNWGLPDRADGEQSAGPILGFSRTDVSPGEDVRAILVPLFVEKVPAWRNVHVGDGLRMYEGWQICGRAIVQWIEPTTWPMGNKDQERFVEWLTSDDAPSPADLL